MLYLSALVFTIISTGMTLALATQIVLVVREQHDELVDVRRFQCIQENAQMTSPSISELFVFSAAVIYFGQM
jgi:hypothetical protein